MSNPLKITVRGDNRMDALRKTAIGILSEDIKAGRLAPLIAEAIDGPEELEPFVSGLEIGMAYAFALALDGKVDLRMITVGSG